jgi:hypothetical protein
MKKNKKAGIYMDHASALIMEFVDGEILKAYTIVSEFTNTVKIESLVKSENLMHNKKSQEQSSYYKKILTFIREYHEVILFGPTDAKSELLNLLKEDHLFEKIEIRVEDTDKMTENQMHDYVRAYFK